MNKNSTLSEQEFERKEKLKDLIDKLRIQDKSWEHIMGMSLSPEVQDSVMCTREFAENNLTEDKFNEISKDIERITRLKAKLLLSGIKMTCNIYISSNSTMYLLLNSYDDINLKLEHKGEVINDIKAVPFDTDDLSSLCSDRVLIGVDALASWCANNTRIPYVDLTLKKLSCQDYYWENMYNISEIIYILEYIQACRAPKSYENFILNNKNLPTPNQMYDNFRKFLKTCEKSGLNKDEIETQGYDTIYSVLMSFIEYVIRYKTFQSKEIQDLLVDYKTDLSDIYNCVELSLRDSFVKHEEYFNDGVLVGGTIEEVTTTIYRMLYILEESEIVEKVKVDREVAFRARFNTKRIPDIIIYLDENVIDMLLECNIIR